MMVSSGRWCRAVW